VYMNFGHNMLKMMQSEFGSGKESIEIDESS
jgi:hypothetical protein